MVRTSDTNQGQLYIPVVNWTRKPWFSSNDDGNLLNLVTSYDSDDYHCRGV